MMSIERHETKQVRAWSQVVVHGNTVYLAGVVGGITPATA